MAQNFKKEEREKQIKRTAMELMLVKDYEDISVQDIIDKMNYSKGGFYHCYNSKAELFMDILMDGIEYRYTQILETKNNFKTFDKKDLILKLFVDKIFDDNEYKKIFARLMIEFRTDKKFYAFYQERIEKLKPDFLSFSEENNFGDLTPYITDEFNIFMYSLIIGMEVFDMYNNQKYRDLLGEIFEAYLEKKNFFDNNDTEREGKMNEK